MDGLEVGRWDVTWTKKMVPFQGTFVDFSGGVIISCNNSMWSSPQADRPHFHKPDHTSWRPWKFRYSWMASTSVKETWRPHIGPPLIFECFIKKNWWIFSTNWWIRGSRSLFLDAKLDQISMDPWRWKTYPNWMNLRNSCDKFALQLGWVLPIIRRKTHHSCLGSTA